MKHTYMKALIGTVMLSVFLMGCNKILDEQPRSIFIPDYFKTSDGVKDGVTAMYSNLRNIYGNMYFYDAGQVGTDEYTWGSSGKGASFNIMDLSAESGTPSPINGSNSDANILWGTAFTSINTANGVLENANAANAAAGKMLIDTALIAEAKFFRGLNYFLLVQTFGGVPLDLGAGVLKFNISTNATSVRNTVPEVYSVIFSDLLQAIQSLPKTPRATGAVTKNVARFYLSKAYLTYAWWLENPNNIPTYPACNRTDPNGQTSQWYFQQAYNLATYVISNPGSYGLQATYYDVNVATNDRNSEIMLYADHTQQSQYYNGADLSYGSGGGMDNFAGWAVQWSYQSMTASSTSYGAWISKDQKFTNYTKVNPVQREAVQPLGRPWVRMAPTIGAITNTFADKVNDSRYDGTFTTIYRGNWPKAGVSNATLYNANNMQVAPGDPILTFLDRDTTGMNYTDTVVGTSSVHVGILPTRSDYILGPSNINRTVYPGLWKLGEYRTDNGNGLGQPNASSTRPWSIAKFSELFFIAAEAAVKGATTSAVTGTYANDGSAYGLINIIRARAGKWRWYNNGNVAKIQDNSAAMVAVTPMTITIDYILQERSREFFGEGIRWYDLVRTQKWNDFANSYQICGNANTEHTPKTYSRSIQPFNYLRPIPQAQIDALRMSDADKAAYQNPIQ